MHFSQGFELPDELQPKFQRAKTLEWVTLFYLISVVILIYLTLGNSQAMKAAFLESLLSILPTVAFLIASEINEQEPNEFFPYGYHRVFSIAFLSGSLVLFVIGCFLFIDSSMLLVMAEHPTIGSIQIMGHQIWMGWLMIVVLCYSAVPSMILGFKKMPLAKELHNKILFTVADTQKADYMTAFAAIAGIIGIGYGLWWADVVAAILISISIMYDGFRQLKTAVFDLMDSYPTHIENHEKDELVLDIENFVRSWSWVQNAKVRLREHGQIYFGEVFVVPEPSADIPEEVEKGTQLLHEYHWKAHDIIICPVSSLPNNP